MEDRGATPTTSIAVMAPLAPTTNEEELIVTRAVIIEVDRTMVSGLTKEGPIISRESTYLTR